MEADAYNTNDGFVVPDDDDDLQDFIVDDDDDDGGIDDRALYVPASPLWLLVSWVRGGEGVAICFCYYRWWAVRGGGANTGCGNIF